MILSIILFLAFNIGTQAKLNTVKISDKLSVSWTNKGAVTHFTVWSPMVPGISANDAWIGVGFNSNPIMAGSNLIVCRNRPNGQVSVSHYYSSGYSPILFDSKNPQTGITDVKVFMNQGMLTCSFSRANTYGKANYFNINPSTRAYILAAFGKGDLSYHNSNRGSTNSLFEFS